MTAILETRNLAAFYGQSQVLHDVDLSIEAGQITVLLGANGAGKTTSLRAVSGMVRTRGDILFEGNRINNLPAESIARLRIGHVPDGRGTFRELTVEENLRLGTFARRDRHAVASDIERFCNYFPRLKERYRQQAGTLSGGEQQMLAISRALLGRPKLLLLDEPSFGLAPRIVADIFEILKRVNEEDKVSMLVVEQNANLALEIASTVYLLETGRVVMSGPASEVMQDDVIRKSYLGF